MLCFRRFASIVASVAMGASLVVNGPSLLADSFGSWGSSGGSLGGSSGGSWGGRYGLFGHGSRGGPVRNLLGRIRDRLHYGFHSMGGSRGGSSGGWGSGGGYVVSYGSSGGSWGSWGGSSGGASLGSVGSSGYTPVFSGYGTRVFEDGIMPDRPYRFEGSQPVDPNQTPPTPAPAPSDEDGAFWHIQEANGEFLLQLEVPEDALVYVNGKQTRSTGRVRKYVARRLIPGQEYHLEIKAVIQREGRQLVRTETITTRAGEQRDLQISFDHTLPPPTTTVTVHVPADAKVYLAGNETKQTGSTRIFSTDALKPGESWADYHIVAEVERNGQILKVEKKLDINAGGSYDLAFDFSHAETRVASR